MNHRSNAWPQSLIDGMRQKVSERVAPSDDPNAVLRKALEEAFNKGFESSHESNNGAFGMGVSKSQRDNVVNHLLRCLQ